MPRLPAIGDIAALAVPATLVGGILLPGAAAATLPALPLLVALLVFAAVMAADAQRFGAVTRSPVRLGLAAAFMQIALPLAAAAAGTLGGADPALVLAAALLLAAPVGTSSHLYAAMAGGNPVMALCLSALTLAAVPLVLPLVALGLPLAGLTLSPLALAGRAAMVVLLPALAAILLRRLLARRGAAARGTAWAWLGLAALLPITFARTTGLGPLLAADPLHALAVTLLIAALLAAAYALTALAFAHAGGADARGIAVASISRNISVTWAATAGLLPVGAEQMLALSALVFYGMPPALRLLARLSPPRPAAA
jgi:predicted Na+-dependent transporter